MMQGLFTAATGLKTHGEGMQVVSNNLANVSTVGYKQQHMLFSDLMYQHLNLGTSNTIIQNQKGLGSAPGAVRTLFNGGAFEQGSSVTDMAITGKGFFQVSDGMRNYYTRAGNFRFDKEGVLRTPTGLSVTGIRLGADGREQGGLTAITVNFNDNAVAVDPPKASTSITALMNVNLSIDQVSDPENPYFSMIAAWDGTQDPPLAAAGYEQPLEFYDSQGNRRVATIHFDTAPAANGQKILEYIVTIPPDQDARANARGTRGAGLLMAGTLTFSTGGELVNMSAFTPGGGDLKDLSNWTPAALSGGVPQFTVSLPGQAAQTISLNLGATGSGGWNQAVANAAAVGAEQSALPGLTSPSYGTTKTSAWPTTSALSTYSQDGYGTGQLSDVSIDASGTITASYSNGQSHDLFRIPLFRFTSEDGLRREGNNLYSATPESGAMEYGTAGTENYGTIQASMLETSNVDISREMVNMIIIQRGFQSNSKSVTTANEMLQKAIELKRN
ncbi:MAG: flagellar hook-basal body complex protein [Desulfovibrionaceae bacterium]|nr:flagellar hook-basal body complex protein [Desulfovibrionaceae bacterium]